MAQSISQPVSGFKVNYRSGFRSYPLNWMIEDECLAKIVREGCGGGRSVVVSVMWWWVVRVVGGIVLHDG